MKPTPLLALGLLAALSGCGGKSPTAPPATPETFASKEGNFEVLMPGSPKDKPQSQPIPGGTLVTHTYTMTDGDKVTRLVSYSDLPKVPATAEEADRLIHAGAETMKRNGAVNSEDPIQFQGHPAHEVKFEVSAPAGGETGRGLCRIILAGPRLYQVLIIGPESKIKEPRMRGYLDSFKLIEPVKPVVEVKPIAKVEPARPSESKPEPEPKPKPVEPVMPETASPSTEPGKSEPGTSAGGVSLLAFRWVDADQDVVGGHNNADQPDGTKDQHLQVDLDLPNDTVLEEITISTGGGNKWVTKPTPGLWPISVRKGDEALTRTHADRIGTLSGKATLDLFLNTGGNAGAPGVEYDLQMVVIVEGMPHTLSAKCNRPGQAAGPAPGRPAPPPRGRITPRRPRR